MTSLLELQTEWIQLHDELGQSFEGQALAAPFFSVPGSARAERPIMLVGKATAGSWGKEEFVRSKKKPINDRVVERLNCTSSHLEWRRNEDLTPSAFWRFRSGLEQISKSVIWTNLAKIGVHPGNPNWRLVRRQSELAYQTLLTEIEEYKPCLIVLVTGAFGRHEIVWRMFGGKDGWQDNPSTGCLCQERSRFLIPVLWTKHPERKPTTDLQLWLRRACELYILSTAKPTPTGLQTSQ